MCDAVPSRAGIDDERRHVQGWPGDTGGFDWQFMVVAICHEPNDGPGGTGRGEQEPLHHHLLEVLADTPIAGPRIERALHRAGP